MQLFICYTPLHILIAQKIIHSEKIESYCFVYLYDNNSKKNEHYYELLEKDAIFSVKVLRTKATFTDFINIYKLSQTLKVNCKAGEINIYTGNIKSVHTRFLMFLLNYTNLYTFDDGCANISNTGYYANSNENNLYKLFFQLFAPSLVYSQLRNKMKIHYTIFKEKNIYPNCKYIDLYNKTRQKNKHTVTKKTILLTSVLSESNITSKKIELELYEAIILQFNVTDIIPHPREENLALDIHIINSHLVSEDILLELSKDYELTVIGIFSSTLLNLAGLDIVNSLISIDFENSHINKELIETFKNQHIECYRYYSNTNMNSIIKL